MPAQSRNHVVHFGDHKGLEGPRLTKAPLRDNDVVTKTQGLQSPTYFPILRRAWIRLEAMSPIGDPLSVESEDDNQLRPRGIMLRS